MKFPSFPFVVLDTETTGFVPRVNRVIEFASVRVEDGKRTDEYSTLISVTEEVPRTVQVLTRIDVKMLDGQPKFDDVRATITKHIGADTLVVGQNVGFDIRMLKGEGVDLSERAWVDTSMLASLVFPELASFSLGYVSKVLKLTHDPVHRALGDVNATLELFGRCWERLIELPEDLLAPVREIFAAGSPGYQLLAQALPKKAKATKHPAWFSLPDDRPPGTFAPSSALTAALTASKKGETVLVEEPLDVRALQGVTEAAIKDRSVTHWIAVKNLEASVRRLRLPENEVRVIHHPSLLLDPAAGEKLLAQDSWTADEATLAVKLHWFRPRVQRDLALLGEERSVWFGKLSCSQQSSAYQDQFKDLPGVVLIDQQQLLTILSSPEHPARGALGKKSHIIIDDTSMLEDTATKAFRWQCVLDHLRAASEKHDILTKFTDLLQIWIERVRTFQDVRYLTSNDLNTQEVEGLRKRLSPLLKDASLTPLVLEQLAHLDRILTADLLPHRIAWIEQRQGGSQYIQSVPDHVGPLLFSCLYAEFPVTLLIPPGSSQTLTEVLPSAQIQSSTPFEPFPVPLEIATGVLSAPLKDPPKGKTIMLIGSRKIIEECFVDYTVALEKKGVTLICQNLSGGLERMQAEFLAADAPVIWLMTPWTYEEVEIPAGTVDHLIIASLPFDHPSHTVLSRRAERYSNAFEQYFLPRLEHRLFRLLRTFCRHRTEAGDVRVTDERLGTKQYGKRVKAYLEGFSSHGETKHEGEKAQLKLL